MSSENAQLRADLETAKAKIERQIEILESPADPLGFTIDNRDLIADLRKELAEIEDCLGR